LAKARERPGRMGEAWERSVCRSLSEGFGGMSAQRGERRRTEQGATQGVLEKGRKGYNCGGKEVKRKVARPAKNSKRGPWHRKNGGGKEFPVFIPNLLVEEKTGSIEEDDGSTCEKTWDIGDKRIVYNI